jgi:glycosyltransferase involved in cell wall biosynthesis
MERTIENTIKSIIHQSGNFEIEYIIVDGASTDNTLSIANNYKRIVEENTKLNCIKVEIKIISEKDRGMYDAINKGFAIASGEILAWLNADDLYLPNTWGKLITILTKKQNTKHQTTKSSKTATDNLHF